MERKVRMKAKPPEQFGWLRVLLELTKGAARAVVSHFLEP